MWLFEPPDREQWLAAHPPATSSRASSDSASMSMFAISANFSFVSCESGFFSLMIFAFQESCPSLVVVDAGVEGIGLLAAGLLVGAVRAARAGAAVDRAAAGHVLESLVRKRFDVDVLDLAQLLFVLAHGDHLSRNYAAVGAVAFRKPVYSLPICWSLPLEQPEPEQLLNVQQPATSSRASSESASMSTFSISPNFFSFSLMVLSSK